MNFRFHSFNQIIVLKNDKVIVIFTLEKYILILICLFIFIHDFSSMSTD